MKRRTSRGIVFGLLAFATVGSSVAQEIPAVGFSALVCRLGVAAADTIARLGTVSSVWT